MAKSKSVTMTAGKIKSSYDLKGKTTLNIVDNYSTGVNADSYLSQFVQSIDASGNNLILNCEDTQGEYKITLKNCTTLATINVSLNNDSYSYTGDTLNTLLYTLKNDITKYNKKLTVTGSFLDDTIDFSDESLYVPTAANLKKNKGLTINAGDGADTITGTKYNDTITGGKGKNTINFVAVTDTIEGTSNFGNDIVNLAKGEKLKIYLRDTDDTTLIPTYERAKNAKGKFTNDLLIKTDKGTVTLKNYYAKETGAEVKINGIDLAKTAKFDFTETNLDKKGAITTSALADKITIDLDNPIKSVYNKKTKTTTEYGATINSGAGDDVITGSKYIDTIKTGNGNDTINGSLGADNITGGAGENTINYTDINQLDGDKITLTKNETLKIDVKGITTNPNNITYKVSDKNLVVTVTNGTDTKSFTINKFGTKDVTGVNGNVKLFYGSGENDYIDLRTTLLDELKITKNYTGTFHADNISAEDYNLYTDKKKTNVDYVNLNKKGLTINGGDGADKIVGSRYSDTIKAGVGTGDYIEGGTGNDKLYASTTKGSSTTFNFKAGDGKDTVYSGKGEDTIRFDSSVNPADIKITKSGKRDLVLNYGFDENGNAVDSVTIKNYYDTKGANVTASVKNVDLSGNKFDIETLKVLIEDGAKISSSAINGSSGDDIIIGTQTSTENSWQYIYGNGGNDIVYCSNGCYSRVTLGDGDDIVYGGDFQTNSYGTLDTGNGNNTIYFGKSLMYTTLGEGNDTIYLNGSQNVYFNGNNADNGITNGGHDTVYYNENAGGYLRFYKTVYDDMVFTRADESDDLVIRYGEDNSVTLKDYYKAGNEGFGNMQMYALKSTANALKVGYTINNAILDKGGAGNDIYNSINISNNVIIEDKGGIDIVNINRSKAEIYFIFNVNKDGTFAEGNDKLLLTNSTYFNNWKTSGILPTYSIAINDFDSIETINTNNGYSTNIAKLNALKSDVASWLSSANGGEGYADVKTALASNDSDLSTLVAMFSRDANWQNP